MCARCYRCARSHQSGWAALAVLLLFPPLLVAEDDKALATIEAQDAAKHAGEKCIVTMKVNSSRLLKDKHIGFLNSSKNYRAADNFAVVIFEDALKKFAARKIDDPPTHYLNKQIQVTGDVKLRRGKPQIILKSPDDIKIIKPESTSPKSDDKAA